MSYEAQVGQAITRLVTEAMTADRTLDQAYAVLEHAAAVCEQATQKVLTLAPPSKPIQCAKGCAWCCTMRISVTPAEVLRIAAHLREHLSPHEFADLQTRLAAAEGRTRGLSWQQHVRLRLPCPLLKDNLCSVHSVRPLVCRSHNSLDAKCCEEYSRVPTEMMVPMYKPQQDITNGTLKGVGTGLSAVGLDSNFVELVAALRVALETPDVYDRWLNGEAIFPTEGA